MLDYAFEHIDSANDIDLNCLAGAIDRFINVGRSGQVINRVASTNRFTHRVWIENIANDHGLIGAQPT